MREALLIHIASLLLIRYLVRKLYALKCSYGYFQNNLECFCSCSSYCKLLKFTIPSDQICAALTPFVYTLILWWLVFDTEIQTSTRYILSIPSKFSCTIDFTLETGETTQIVYFFYRKSPDLLNVGFGLLFLSFVVIPVCHHEVIMLGGNKFENMVCYITKFNFL